MTYRVFARFDPREILTWSEFKSIYRHKISFFVFEIIEIEYEFDYSIYSEISLVQKFQK
jgi:hypothetical protein